MFLSYRNQSDDLQNKSVDWFLYVGNIGRLKGQVEKNYKMTFIASVKPN